jgi:hypothetical protein
MNIKYRLRRISLDIFQTNGLYLFLFYLIFSFLISYITSNLILTDSKYFNYLGEQLSYERVTEFINLKNKWLWLGYIFTPILYLLKFSAVSLCILAGILLSNIKISFYKVFKVVLVSDVIFLFAIVIKTLYFLYTRTNFTITDYMTFYPFSLINLVDTSNLLNWLKYPIQLLNLFEILYILLITTGISIELRIRYREAFKIVSLSYFSGLLIYIVFITFLTV